ncbi:MAG: hypothetical protein ACFCVH_01890 [Alphaproteobacteria bacterium]
MIAVAGLIGVLAVVGLAIWLVLDLMAGTAERRGAPALQPRTAPPQTAGTPIEDPETLLTTHGWSDRAGGIARIPVDEAMRLLAERGWPSAGEPDR